jgi:hypothetical protein
VTIARETSGLVDLCTPEQVGRELAAALTALLHTGLRHAGASENCAECRAGGRALAPALGAALLACRRRGRSPLTNDDLAHVGVGLEVIEEAACTRVTIKRRA